MNGDANETATATGEDGQKEQLAEIINALNLDKVNFKFDLNTVLNRT